MNSGNVRWKSELKKFINTFMPITRPTKENKNTFPSKPDAGSIGWGLKYNNCILIHKVTRRTQQIPVTSLVFGNFYLDYYSSKQDILTRDFSPGNSDAMDILTLGLGLGLGRALGLELGR